MLVSLRRQRPRAVLAVICSAVLALILYGHLGNGLVRLGGLRRGGCINVDRPTSFKYALQPPPKGGVRPSKEMLRYWKQLLKAMMDAKPKTRRTVVIQDGVTDDDIQPNTMLDKDRERVDKAHLPDDLRDAIKTAHAKFVLVARSLGIQLPFAGKTFGMPAAAYVGKNNNGGAGQTSQDMVQQEKMGMRGKSRARAARAAKAADEKVIAAQPTEPGTTTKMPTTPAGVPPVAASTTRARSSPSRGIVMTAGGPYVGIAVTSILMLRRNGSKLPVQLFLGSDLDYNEQLCEKVLPSLGAECHVMQRFWETTPEMPALERFQFKVFSILLSSFQEVLFFDADCWPIHNPDYLFDKAPFTSHGLVTWPDFWMSTTAPVLYNILDVAPPRLTERRSSESGVLLYDKARHGTSLIMAAYYNFYGPDFYYPLLSQGAIGQGDKETFLHGAMVMGNPFYAVHTPIGILGRWINGTYIGAAMRQADPVEDYRLVREQELGGRENGGGSSDGGGVGSPKAAGPRHHVQQQQQRSASGGSEETVQARWLFVHHNLFKIDLRHLGKSMRGVYAENDQGAMSRLWDVGADFSGDAGYDVERAMWDEVRKAVCSHNFWSTRECDDLQRYYEAVFQ